MKITRDFTHEVPAGSLGSWCVLPKDGGCTVGIIVSGDGPWLVTMHSDGTPLYLRQSGDWSCDAERASSFADVVGIASALRAARTAERLRVGDMGCTLSTSSAPPKSPSWRNVLAASVCGGLAAVIAKLIWEAL